MVLMSLYFPLGPIVKHFVTSSMLQITVVKSCSLAQTVSLHNIPSCSRYHNIKGILDQEI